jgi:hypothetical protein
MWRKVLVTLCLLAPAAYGATIGELRSAGSTINIGNPGTPLTTIDVARPATAAGTVKVVKVMWAGSPTSTCADAMKIKFFRPQGSGFILVTADYGPFAVHNGFNTISIPPVAIEKGDWIGVTQLNSDCGGVALSNADTSDVRGVKFGDPTGNATEVSFVGGYVPSIVGSTSPEVLQGYFPVAGSLRGAGADFKTSAQLKNLNLGTINGKLVFHPANVPAQDTDPFIAFTVSSFGTLFYDDVVQAMGASGLGTMDLIITSGQPPHVSLRVYSDAGANGTSGLTEELRTPWQAHYSGETATLAIPTDLTKFRLNIGYRALEQGAAVSISVHDAHGVRQLLVTDRNLPANTMNQETALAFTDQTALPPGGTIYIRVLSGSAFFYGAVTDNRTNDPNLLLPTKF